MLSDQSVAMTHTEVKAILPPESHSIHPTKEVVAKVYNNSVKVIRKEIRLREEGRG